MPARHSAWEAARRGDTLPHEAQRWLGVGWCVASLRLLGAGGQRAEPPGRLLHFFSSSKEKQGDEAALRGDLAGPPMSPWGSFTGGPALAQRAVGGPGMEAGDLPEEQGAAGQQLPTLEDWGEPHPALYPGAAPSPPGAQCPHHAHTDTESTPLVAGPRLPHQPEQGGVGGIGGAPVRGSCGGPNHPSCWGLRQGTTWDRLRPLEVAPPSRPLPPTYGLRV